MKKTLVVASIFMFVFMTGCTQENHKDPVSTTGNLYDYSVYIDISAEGEGEYVPFWGECDLWAVSQPVSTPPPPGDPVKEYIWGPSTQNPTLIWSHDEAAYYLYWYGYQIVRPPNGGWEVQTVWYEGYVPASEDYYDDCIFEKTK